MATLMYVNNVRGFQGAYIPLEHVNFLVGENSTGKSSLLSLIALIHQPLFWMNQDFNAGDVRLGTFQDLVSIESRNRQRFDLGYCSWKAQSGSRPPRIYAFLLSFCELDGLPVVQSYDLVRDDFELRAEFTANKGTYTVSRLPKREATADDLMTRFRSWVSEIGAARYKRELPSIQGVRRRQLLPIIESLVAAKESKPKSDDSISVSLHVPGPPLAWIAPIRTKPRRTYDEFSTEFSSEGMHTPYLIRKLMKSAKQKGLFGDYIAKFGKDAGLYQSLVVEEFGQDLVSPFALEVRLDRVPLNIANVGYGVSQSLPVVVEIFARTKQSGFAIQQPEIHLHPRAQAALGELFYRLAVEEDKRFFIESHSDFMIDRFRLHMSTATAKTRPTAQVLFFVRKDGVNQVSPIVIQDNGAYAEDQPAGFRDFFVKEQLQLLRIQ
jgi:hypothetical protein